MKFLPEFQLPESVAIDYMHGILLGVMKKLMSLWFDGKYHQLPFYIGHRLEDVDKILSSVKPPYQINRTPRKISGNVQHWKASEFRSWLLFYCIPCLKGILPDVYLTHLACLVEGIFILRSDSIPLDKLDRAEKLLQNFYGNFVELYGEAAAGLNVHNILHLSIYSGKLATMR
ncbi:hypothetical protein FSP39_021454 [Pinctada imbricata]|uniref:Uncharacterized protein n=1 Tax=Pinctada imbricata TaxID=66713 RepID=A0AA89CB48_PINIB|nr:hypothetical protein FSP39_021454 [Pinctada imbricata]